MSNGLIPKREKGTIGSKLFQVILKHYGLRIMILKNFLKFTTKIRLFLQRQSHPFRSSGLEDNPDPNQFDENMGFEKFDNNRSTRIKELIDEYEKINYTDLKKLNMTKISQTL